MLNQLQLNTRNLKDGIFKARNSGPSNIGPYIMGIVNATPDSFSDGGKYNELESGLEHALQLIEDGADILDIGGESTRPGAKEVPIDEEIRRTAPLIKEIRKHSDIAISIDTRKPEVAIEAVKAGANIWNDVSALTFSENSLKTAIDLNVPVVMMHYKGLPENMQDNPRYNNVVNEVMNFLSMHIGNAIHQGMKPENIIIDVGIGFGKSLEHNLELLAKHNDFRALGYPLLLGVSRKSMIGMIDEKAKAPNKRLGGSLAIAIMSEELGANIIRVHDVFETKQAFLIKEAIKKRNI